VPDGPSLNGMADARTQLKPESRQRSLAHNMGESAKQLCTSRRMRLRAVLVAGVAWLVVSSIMAATPSVLPTPTLDASAGDRCAPRERLCVPPLGWQTRNGARAKPRMAAERVPLRLEDVAIGVFTAASLHSTRGRWITETWGGDAPSLAFLTDAAAPAVDEHTPRDRTLVIECPEYWKVNCTAYGSHLYKSNLGAMALLDRFPTARYINLVCDDHYIHMHNLLLHLENFEDSVASSFGQHLDPTTDAVSQADTSWRYSSHRGGGCCWQHMYLTLCGASTVRTRPPRLSPTTDLAGRRGLQEQSYVQPCRLFYWRRWGDPEPSCADSDAASHRGGDCSGGSRPRKPPQNLERVSHEPATATCRLQPVDCSLRVKPRSSWLYPPIN
jgi:hypothetical protein